MVYWLRCSCGFYFLGHKLSGALRAYQIHEQANRTPKGVTNANSIRKRHLQLVK